MEHTKHPSEKTLKFSFTIDCVFKIFGRGTLVTGRIEQGTIHIGDRLEILGNNQIHTACTEIEKCRKSVEKANKGDYVAIYLTGVLKSELKKGMKLVIYD